MNSNIAKNDITNGSGETKKHQAYAMELSRVRKAKKNCEGGDCAEYMQIGGEAKFNELNNLVKQERTKDEIKRKVQKDTNPENTYNKVEDPTKIGIKAASVSPSSNHRTTASQKIMSNDEALHEGLSKEILEIRYLIEYMNNNKKQNL